VATDARGGAIIPDAPFPVKASRQDRSGGYEKEPEVMSNSRPARSRRDLRAEWTDEGWKFGKRVADA
jgi:hypothetical protein